MKRIYQIGNGIAFVSMIIVNYLSNTGMMNNTTIGDISNSIDSKLTPAGYTFAIWGLIYLLLFVFIIRQGSSLFLSSGDDSFVNKTGWWFIISCLFNSLWVIVWIYGYVGISCIILFLLLYSIFKIILVNEIALTNLDSANKLMLWTPFVVYAGWVTVASIVNVSAYLVSISWGSLGISEPLWTQFMLLIAVLIIIIVSHKRGLILYGLVGSWALIGIANANSDEMSNVELIAYIGASILLLDSVFIFYKKNFPK